MSQETLYVCFVCMHMFFFTPTYYLALEKAGEVDNSLRFLYHSKYKIKATV